MGRKKAETQPEAQNEAPKKKARKLDVEALRTLADQCPSKAVGELLIESIDTYVTARAAYVEASKNLRADAKRARSRTS